MPYRVYYDLTTLRVVGIEFRTEALTPENVPQRFKQYGNAVLSGISMDGAIEDNIWKDGRFLMQIPATRTEYNNMMLKLLRPDSYTDAEYLSALKTAARYRY